MVVLDRSFLLLTAHGWLKACAEKIVLWASSGQSAEEIQHDHFVGVAGGEDLKLTALVAADQIHALLRVPGGFEVELFAVGSHQPHGLGAARQGFLEQLILGFGFDTLVLILMVSSFLFR